MNAKSIDQMIAELPPNPKTVPDVVLMGLDDYGSLGGLLVAQHKRALAEIAVLKAAAEKRHKDGHSQYCGLFKTFILKCTCGFDDMEKVLEALK